MTSGEADARTQPGCATRLGSAVAALVNAVLIYVAHHLLEWGWPRFLTDDFEEVLPLLTLSLALSTAANLSFVVHRGARSRAAWDTITSAGSAAASIQLLAVFPFDFSTYAHNWSWLARTVVLVGVVGSSVAAVVNLARLLTSTAVPGVGFEPTRSRGSRGV